MNRGAVFVAGVVTGALLLAVLVVGWYTQVRVAPTPGPVAVPSAAADAALAPADLPAPVPVSRGVDAPLMQAPHPDVVVAPPARPLPGDPLVEAVDGPGVAPPGQAPDSDAAPGDAPASEAPSADAPEGAAARALSLVIPVDGITAAQLTDTFTDARGQSRVHDAIDIMAPTGTPVRAVADGRIVKLFTSVPGGLTIYQFDASDQVAFYYAHLDRYADGVAEGQAVKQGDLIGYVGYTGNASPDGPHLHFAIMALGPEKNWWQGQAINPYPYLRQAGSR